MLFAFKIGKSRIGVKKEIIIPLLFLAFTAVYYWQTLGFSDNALVFPRFLMIIMVFCGIFTLMGCFCRLAPDEKLDRGESLLAKIVVLFCIALIAFMAVFDYLGVYVSLFIFTLVSMLLAGRRNWLTMIIVSIGVCVFIWAVFSLWLHIRMPMGILKFLL